jgi:hypothetical protein
MDTVYQNPPVDYAKLAPLIVKELQGLVIGVSSHQEIQDAVNNHIERIQKPLAAYHVSEIEAEVKSALDYMSAYVDPDAVDVPFRVNFQDVDPGELWGLGRASMSAHGVFIVDNFLPIEAVDQAHRELNEIEEIARRQFELSEFLETDNLIVDHPTEPQVVGFPARANNPKCYVFSRPEEDAGIIEFFNVDRACPAIKSLISPRLAEADIVDAVRTGAGSPTMRARHLNAYINATNPTTRGLHLDTQKWMAKGFVYLTDVNHIEDGPFAYAPGSHKSANHMKRLCIDYNEQVREFSSPRNLEMDLQNQGLTYPVLAKKGTFILGYTCGIHRGMPRVGETRREVLIQNYY